VQGDVLAVMGREPADRELPDTKNAAEQDAAAWDRVKRTFHEMLDNLWYTAVYQMKGRCVHSESMSTDLETDEVLLPPGEDNAQQYKEKVVDVTTNKMASEVMYMLSGLRTNLVWDMPCTLFVVPSVAVELSVLRRVPEVRGGRQGPPVQGFRTRSPFFTQAQGIRLHMERRRPIEENEALAANWEAQEERRACAGRDPERMPRLKLQPYPSFGSRNPTGPSGYKMSLDGQAAALAADGPILYGLSEVLEPTAVARGQEKVTPVLSVYETWIRSHDKKSILFAKQKDYKGILHALLAPEHQVRKADKMEALRVYVKDLVRDRDDANDVDMIYFTDN
jgi:hypothetical protein